MVLKELLTHIDKHWWCPSLNGVGVAAVLDTKEPTWNVTARLGKRGQIHIKPCNFTCVYVAHSHNHMMVSHAQY
jgi:hypothetical protein